MPIISPKEITAKAEKAYFRFLPQWIRREDSSFFPLRVRTNLSFDAKRPSEMIAATERLVAASKESRGWGYTVHRRRVRSRDLGSNDFPKTITIDTLDDLLKLCQKIDEFSSTCEVVDQIRTELPQLESWLHSNVRSLAGMAGHCKGLIRVAKFFLEHPWPDCYARQIPVPVDTKFVSRHSRTLRQWLDELLPASAIDVNETKFARRFGLRDGQRHRGIRLLDPALSKETGLPHGELSLPLRSIAQLEVRDATIFIVENDLNLATMPSFSRGIGIRGEGNAVNRLERVKWLADNRVYYWGDVDVEGFMILSRLRNILPSVESVLMDLETIQTQEEHAGQGNGTHAEPPTNLTPAETAAFVYCTDHDYRLEQEKVVQAFVDLTFSRIG